MKAYHAPIYSPELYEQKCSAVFEHIFEAFQQAEVA